MLNKQKTSGRGKTGQDKRTSREQVGQRASRQSDRSSGRNRTRERPREEAEEDAQDTEPGSVKAVEIPGTGDREDIGHNAASVDAAIGVDLDRILKVTPRQLNELSPKAAGDHVARVLFSGLTSLSHGALNGLHRQLAGVYHVNGVLMRVHRDPKRLRAVEKGLGLGRILGKGRGGRYYMELFKATGPLPAEDGSGERRRMQNRYSDYNCACLAASALGLSPRDFLVRLMNDHGIEKLIEEDRANKRQEEKSALDGQKEVGANEADQAPPSVMSRGQKRGLKREQEKEALNELAAQAERQARGRSDRELSKAPADPKEKDLFESGTSHDTDATVEVLEAAKPLFTPRRGKLVFVGEVSGGRSPHLVVHCIQPMPRHSCGKDEDALRAMILAIRK